MSAAATQIRPSGGHAVQPDLTLTTNHVSGIVTVRHWLAQGLESHGFAAPLVDTAMLLATELISNALTHTVTTSGPVTVRLDVHWNSRRLVMAVTDPDPRLPVAGTADPDAEHGRGLTLVEALATRWGSREVLAGKTVWCLIT